MKRTTLPVLAFGVLFAFMAVGLTLKPREVPSPLIGKAAPAFSLPLLDAPSRSLSLHDMRGKVWLLNVWASWCAACRLEHPTVLAASKTGTVPIYGLNYKDKPADAQRWLDNFGNPYQASLSDVDGLVGIDFGVYGVPETFVIDKAGVIRHKVIGQLTPEVWRNTVLPLVKKLDG